MLHCNWGFHSAWCSKLVDQKQLASTTDILRGQNAECTILKAGKDKREWQWAKKTRTSLPVWLSALLLTTTLLSVLINARTTSYKHQWVDKYVTAWLFGLVTRVGSQNDLMFHVKIAKIAFPPMFLMLNVVGSNVCRFLDHVTRWGTTRPSYNLCAAA